MDNSIDYFKTKAILEIEDSLKTTLSSIDAFKLALEDTKDIEEYKTIDKQIEELIIKYNNLLADYRNLIIRSFEQAYIKDNYNLTTQDIYKMLDVAPSKVTKTLQHHVDHIKTVRYTGEFFELPSIIELFGWNFVSLRELKNTKIFYNLDRFAQFLYNNLECLNVPEDFSLDLEQLVLDVVNKDVWLYNANTLKDKVVLAEVKERNRRIAINNLNAYFNVISSKNAIETLDTETLGKYNFSYKGIDMHIQLQKLEINNVQLQRYLKETQHLKFKLSLDTNSSNVLYLINSEGYVDINKYLIENKSE